MFWWWEVSNQMLLSSCTGEILIFDIEFTRLTFLTLNSQTFQNITICPQIVSIRGFLLLFSISLFSFFCFQVRSSERDHFTLDPIEQNDWIESIHPCWPAFRLPLSLASSQSPLLPPLLPPALRSHCCPLPPALRKAKSLPGPSGRPNLFRIWILQ
jgi:hypothetical protein